jgi:hypothetical protein
MKSRLSRKLSAAAFWIGVSSNVSGVTSIQVITEGKTEIVGSTSAVPGGGSAANFSTAAIVVGTTFANFRMVLADGSNTRFADLRITPVAIKGALDTAGGTQSGLMVAQTSNSQGLNDSGTFSILTDFASADGTGISSMTFRLDWFAPDTQTPLPVSAEITSFDYDFNQFLRVGEADFTSARYGSALTLTSTGGSSTWQAGNSDSTFSNPAHAVILNTTSDSSMLIEVGKIGSGNSLFMFEFRDPSLNLVPEPSTALLSFAGLAGWALRRRRNA